MESSSNTRFRGRPTTSLPGLSYLHSLPGQMRERERGGGNSLKLLLLGEYKKEEGPAESNAGCIYKTTREQRAATERYAERERLQVQKRN